MIETQGMKPGKVKGEILAGRMDDHNTFDAPDQVKDQPFTAFTVLENGVRAELPPCSVVHLAVR